MFDAKGNRAGGAALLAVVTSREGHTGRHYRLPTDDDYRAVWRAQKRLKGVAAKTQADGLGAIRTSRCRRSGRWDSASGAYGMTQWGDLFTARQNSLSLSWFRSTVRLSENQVQEFVNCSR